MAIELRQSLMLSQQLIMTPQLQQAIKLLQLSRFELQEAITQELEENPLLEELVTEQTEEDVRVEHEKDMQENSLSDNKEGDLSDPRKDEMEWEAYLSEYNSGWAETPYDRRETTSFENMVSAKTNLYSHLFWQLSMSNLDKVQRLIGINIIGNLNPDGYLDISMEELIDVTGQPVEKVVEVLNVIQNFDPVGVAARDMKESLLIQIKFQQIIDPFVERIINYHLEDIESRRYDQIAKNLHVTTKEVLYSISIIQSLEPKPGRLYSNDETIYISPDVYVYKINDKYEIILNEDGLPKLRINGYYKDVMRDKEAVSDNVKTYIQDKLKSAAWLIKSINQRQKTIYRVTESIIRFQEDFLAHGRSHLKPLVLRDVAEDIEMHESTISRVTTNKYVHTPQGVLELKYFFNSSVSSVDGDAIGSESVKEHIRNIIKSENKHKPYSDKRIADILESMNIKIARRTVAKYRESMNILPSRKRSNPY